MPIGFSNLILTSDYHSVFKFGKIYIKDSFICLKSNTYEIAIIKIFYLYIE